MRRPASQKVENQQLKVQELVIRKVDTQLLSASVASHSIILIGEPVDAAVNVMLCDDSASALVLVQASATSVVNSSDYNPVTGAALGASTYGRDSAGNALAQAAVGYNPGQQDAIKVANLQMDTNDAFIVRYISVY